MIKIKFVKKLDKKISLVSLDFKNDSRILVLPGGQKSISLGIGKKEDFNRRKLMLACRKLISLAKSNKIKQFAINFPDFIFKNIKITNYELSELLAVNFEVANFGFIKYKTKPKDGWNFIEEIIIVGGDAADIRRGFERGQVIGQGINGCRVLANTPGGEMTPGILANKAKGVAKNTKIKTKILGLSEIKKFKMGGVLGVSRGSSEEPKFIVMEYMAGGKDKPIVLVGKGVTFDSGGLGIKPSASMCDMRMDMSGGAAVIYALTIAAKLKIKKNIVVIVPAVENMPSGSSYRPGDVLKTMSGKTIEVLHTDAEGRIILADALTYAKRYNPKLVVDVATLTGGALAALGQRASAIFTGSEKLEKTARELGEISGDYVWPLPLWDEYEDDIKAAFGDIANVGKTRYGSAITAAIFLYQFAKDYPWLHIDIAPRMVSIEGDYLAKGSAGAPVKLLIKLLERI